MVRYMVEHAKSARAKVLRDRRHHMHTQTHITHRARSSQCNKCKATIAKDECRVGKLSESTTEHGQCKWYHVHCFAPPRTLKAATSLEGFDALDADEQHAVEQQFDVGTHTMRSRSLARAIVDAMSVSLLCATAKKPTSQQLSEARNLTPRELHVCQFVEKLALPTLTEILRLNHLRIDGTKPYLIERVFDGMARLPPSQLPLAATLAATFTAALLAHTRHLWSRLCGRSTEASHLVHCATRASSHSRQVRSFIAHSPIYRIARSHARTYACSWLDVFGHV